MEYFLQATGSLLKERKHRKETRRERTTEADSRRSVQLMDDKLTIS